MRIRSYLGFYASVAALLGLLALAASQSLATANPLNPPSISNAPTFGAHPFPATPAMTDTVQAIGAALNQSLQPLTPPDGVFIPQLAEPNETIAASAKRRRVLLPVAARVRRSDPEPSPPPGQPADVAVALRATPSVRIQRGGLLAFEIKLLNHGQGAASSARVRLPYPRHQLAHASSSFAPGSGDWVSAIENDAITVTFGPLAAGARRSATLSFRVGSTLANDTVINIRATHNWSDARIGGGGATNWTPVLVGAGNSDSAYLWLTATPSTGKVGTVHQFFSDRFIPGEGIVPWLNTPTGVRPLELRTTADIYGRIWINLSTIGLAPGNYSLVAYGARSNLTGVAGFTVLP